MRPTASAVTSSGGGAAGHRRSADHDVALADHARELLALACVEVLAHRLGVAAAVLGVRGVEIELDETRAEALDLLGDGGPDIVGLHDRAQPSRRRDRLQAGDAGADHEHARGGDGAGGGHHQREHLREFARGQQHRPVARDRGHRAERVHRLRATDPRQQLEGERAHPALRERRDRAGAPEGIEQPDNRLALAQALDLRGALGRADAGDDVGSGQHFRGARGDPRSRGEVVLVGEARGAARAALDEQLGAAVADPGHNGGNERHAALTVHGLR